jgi:hypothetical protein
MAKSLTEVKFFHLHGTKDGIISVAHIHEPYGEGSQSVVSIGVDLHGNFKNPEWKVHIPYENIDDLIEGLQIAKEEFGKEYEPDENAIPLPFDESIGGD